MSEGQFDSKIFNCGQKTEGTGSQASLLKGKGPMTNHSKDSNLAQPLIGSSEATEQGYANYLTTMQ